MGKPVAWQFLDAAETGEAGEKAPRKEERSPSREQVGPEVEAEPKEDQKTQNQVENYQKKKKNC